MKYVKQFAIIMAVCLVGEAIEALVPLPVPGNVYGMVLMFILLCLKVVRVEQVKDVAGFLIAIMSIFFVPAGVGLISAWPMERSLLIASVVAVCALTLVVMGVAGHVTQLVQRVSRGRSDQTSVETGGAILLQPESSSGPASHRRSTETEDAHE